MSLLCLKAVFRPCALSDRTLTPLAGPGQTDSVAEQRVQASRMTIPTATDECMIDLPRFQAISTV